MCNECIGSLCENNCVSNCFTVNCQRECLTNGRICKQVRTCSSVSNQCVLVELNHKGGKCIGNFCFFLNEFCIVTRAQRQRNISDVEELIVLKVLKELLGGLGAIHQQTVRCYGLIQIVALGVTEIIGVALQIEMGDFLYLIISA